MAPTRWLNEDEQRAWQAYLGLTRQLAAAMERQLADSGVSGADYQVLAPLTGSSSRGIRPRDLARWTGWDRSRLAHHLRRMEERGLIVRESHPEDGRGSLVRITRAGRDAMRAAAPGHVEWVRDNFIDLLSPEERERLIGISQRVLAKLADDFDETPDGG
ncbi:MAG: MarR family winged helix-turn-helix transcriptional regulator [Mycobacteriales bacterium]